MNANKGINVVVSGSFKQYCECCQRLKLDPIQTIYATEKSRLYGIGHDVQVIYTGEYWTNPCFGEPFLQNISNGNEIYDTGENYGSTTSHESDPKKSKDIN